MGERQDDQAVDVALLGVRHHGPGSARSVVAALEAIQPTIVLIEFPAEATDALSWIGRDGLVPPVALLGYVVNEPWRAVFSPLAVFSPEWQAVAWANRNGVPVRAIDLPLANTLARPSGDDTGELGEQGDLGLAARVRDPIGALAAAAGETDAERWWDDVIEHRGDGLAAFEAVAEAMAAVRAGTLTPRDEERREAHMRKSIRTARREGHERIAVVCGAWHVPALDVTSSTSPAAPTASVDQATLRGLPKVKVAMSWVPWTHPRLASASGYGAGVRSPGWYAHVFEHPGPQSVTRFFAEAAQVVRRHGIGASPDHLIAATRLADTLSVLRGRPQPGLDEVLDAASAVMGATPLIDRELVVGSAIGSVPDDAPQVPLARDLTVRQRSARLKPSAIAEVVELDVRTPNGRRRSHLLHQLQAIGVPWGVIEEGRGSSGTFRETWRLQWQPEFSVRLIEFAGYGTTVESAATARLIERAAQAKQIVEIASALELALLASLPEAVDPVVEQLARRAATDPDIVELMGALSPLAQAQRYGDVRATDVEAVARVFDGLVVRVLAGLVATCHSVDDDAAAIVIERLSTTQQALALVDHTARQSAFPRVLMQLAEMSGGHGLIAGRATRLLHDGGAWTRDQVANRVSRALSGGTPAAVGAAFVEGFLAGSGTVLVHDSGLLAVIDTWLATLPAAAFEATVPLLRRTFGAFEAAERRQIGELVTRGVTTHAPTWGSDLDPQRTEQAVATVRHLLGLAPATSTAESHGSHGHGSHGHGSHGAELADV